MLSLIKKDLKLSFNIKTIVSVILLVLFICFTQSSYTGSSMIQLIFFMVPSISMSYIFAYDDHYKTDIIFTSLPVTRTDIVTSKFLSIFAVTALSCLLSGLIIFGLALTHIFGFEMSMFKQIFTLAVGRSLLISLFIACISIPLFTKFGFRKAKILWIGFYVMAFVVLNKHGLFDRILDYFGISNINFMIVSVVVFAVMAILSYMVTLVTYKRKNF